MVLSFIIINNDETNSNGLNEKINLWKRRKKILYWFR